jgi:hypothetical protein
MEQLFLQATRSLPGPVSAISGKVGGYTFYGPHLRALKGAVALEESPRRSSYRIGEAGEIAFVQDADARYPLVSLASLVGKWVRDQFMHRVSHFHNAHDGDVHDSDMPNSEPSVSGYHDPRTQAFVARSARQRSLQMFPIDCFERRKAKTKQQLLFGSERLT